MNNPVPDNTVLQKAQSWLAPEFDEETRKQVQYLIENDNAELTESFYTDLEFGTGGLRGIMGVGTNRMNKYTVGMATQGLANYLKKMFPEVAGLSTAIAFDSRNNSSFFAQTAAGVLSANGIKVYLFEGLRPTPELSFAVRHLGCKSGIVITASHNPKEYNGYKVYWDDGGQLVPPHDKNVIDEVRAITSPAMVRFGPHAELISIIGSETDRVYLQKVKELSFIPDVISAFKDFGIVYTPLHGTGITLVPEALKMYGFQNIHIVQQQAVADGNFPTVASPNPEEKAALAMAIEQARACGAELVLATDPDADRVGIAVKDHSGEFVLLNGNQTASVLIMYLLEQWQAHNRLKGNEFIVKTIVTSELLKSIADGYNVPCYDVLTGFKYIAAIIREKEDSMQFIGGGEESYGYLVGDFVRDKDAVISCCLIAEAAVYAKSRGMSFFSWLLNIYGKFGMYYEGLVSVTRKGKSGAEEIKAMMDGFRKQPPVAFDGSPVVMIRDYKLQQEYNIINGARTVIDLPVSDVLQFFTEDGSKITVRPSGTEPKIKFYFGIKTELPLPSDFREKEEVCRQKIARISKGLNL